MKDSKRDCPLAGKPGYFCQNPMTHLMAFLVGCLFCFGAAASIPGRMPVSLERVFHAESAWNRRDFVGIPTRWTEGPEVVSAALVSIRYEYDAPMESVNLAGFSGNSETRHAYDGHQAGIAIRKNTDVNRVAVWPSRDPIGEKGGENLYGFVLNRPIGICDKLGLVNYSYSEAQPTGLWMVTLQDVPDGEHTFKGFHSRYLPVDGKVPASNPQPRCPCKSKDIILVQAIIDATGHPAQLDTDAGPGRLPRHSPNDPIRPYIDAGKLTIIDAPHAKGRIDPGMPGTWKIEDCAVWRTRPDANSVNDVVLGCVTFTFHRTNITTADIGKDEIINSYAVAPGDLWRKAFADWKNRKGGDT